MNYPGLRYGTERRGIAVITILHQNIPNMLGQFTTILADKGINISLMTNKSRKEYAYTMIDVDAEVPTDLKEKLGRSLTAF